MGVPSGGIVVSLNGRPEDDGLVCGVLKIYGIGNLVKERANEAVVGGGRRMVNARRWIISEFDRAGRTFLSARFG